MAAALRCPGAAVRADDSSVALARCVEVAEAADHAAPDIDHPDFHLDSARLRAMFDVYSACARDWAQRQRDRRRLSGSGS
jgi:hypothetical protein